MDLMTLLAAVQAQSRQRPQQFGQQPIAEQGRLEAALSNLNQMMRQQRPDGQIQGQLSIEGGGAVEGGLLAGGGRATMNMPMDMNTLLQLHLGGGGAIGSVPTPHGQQKVREFTPSFGLGINRQF